MRAIAAAVLAAGAFGLAARADDEPLTRAEVDRRAAKVAYDTADFGTRLWQAGNYEGTFRCYQGVLYALKPMLDHRPKLAALVQEKFDKAFDMRPEEGAFLLREALDAVMAEAGGATPGKKTAPPPREKDKPDPKPADKKVAAVKTLKDRLGGTERVQALARDVAAAVVADAKTAVLGDVKPADRPVAEVSTRDLLTGQFNAILSADDSARVPAGAGLTWDKWSDEEFGAVVGHVRAVLEKAGVGAAEVAEVVGRVEQVRKAAGKK